MASNTTRVPDRRLRQVAVTRKMFVLGVFLVAQVVFLTSAIFRVQAVEVVGNVRLSDALIRSQADIGLQDSLLTVPLKAVARSVECLHWVHHATVYRLLPGRICIRVEERKPALLVRR